MIIRFHPVNQYTRSTKKVPWLTDWATSSSVDNGPAIICRPHNGCHGWGRRIANVRRTLYWTFKLASLQFWIKKRIWAACQDFGTLLNPILTVVIAFARRKGPPTGVPVLIKQVKAIVWAQKREGRGFTWKRKTHRAAVSVAIITTTIIAVASVIGWRVRFPTIGPSYVHLTLSETVITAS